MSVGLARTIYIRCIYGVFGREITKYTVYIYGSGQPYCSDAQPMARYILLSNLLRLCDTCTFKRPVESSAPSTSIHICPQKHAWSGGALSNCTCYSASLFPTAHVTAHHFFQLHMLQRIIFPAAHVTAHYFFQLHMLQCITFLASIASLEITGPGTWVTAGLSNSQAVSGHIITVLLPKEYRVWDLEGHGRLQKHISFDRSHIHCFPNYTGPEIWRDTAGSTNT